MDRIRALKLVTGDWSLVAGDWSLVIGEEEVTTGEYPGDGLPKPVAFSNPSIPGITTEIDGVRVIILEKLIELKLASGISASHRLRDLADVQDLIAHLNLPLSLAEQLNPFVQATYQDLWQKTMSR